MLKKIQEYKDLIIIVSIHILMPIMYFLVFISFLFALFESLIWAIGTDFDKPEINIKILVFIIVCLLYFIIFILRLCILPILYSYFEKTSKNNFLKTFILNLKNNTWYRICMLIIVEIPFLLLILNSYTVHIPRYKDYITLHAILTCSCDLLSCYIVLFLWWDIQKLINKFRNNS